jgi:signal peptidase II
MRHPSVSRIGVLLILLATVGCDRATKQAAATLLADAPVRSFLGDTVRLIYAENAGGFLGIGADLSVEWRLMVFTAATGLLLLALLLTAVHQRWHGARLLGAALIVAGGASNWIDRLATGSVIDFLNVGVGPVRTGVFNVADVAIMAGAGVLGLAVLSGAGRNGADVIEGAE